MTAALNPDRNFKYWLLAPAIFLLLLVGLFSLIYSLIVSFMRIYMQRAGTADEFERAAIWLLSGDASYVTGSILNVSGGR